MASAVRPAWAQFNYAAGSRLSCASDMPQAALVPFGQEPVQLRASMARVNFPLPWRPTCMPITSTWETEGTTQVTVNQPGLKVRTRPGYFLEAQ